MSKILVVDDEPDILQILEAALKKEGYEVARAGSGRECLETLDEVKPNIILLDIMLPDIGGIEVLKAVQERLPETEVIMITAHATTERAIAALKLGAYDFLQKPFDNDELLASIARCIEKQRLERELKEYSERLEQKVEERTRELEETTKRLERSNKLKDLFIDIMGHDLLNTVSVIKNVSSTLTGDASLAQQPKSRLMLRNIEKLEKIIKDASTYGRLERAEKLDFKERDLAAVIGDAIEGLQSLVDEKGIKIECEFRGEYPAPVNHFIEDVFSNLLSNAIKYSPENSRIIVGIENDSDSWKVYVKDYGEGIPDEDKEAIFERFVRAGRKKVMGTGLGLAIVKRIVELHKGRVWVEDNPKGGSIFYVTVPK